MSDRKSHSIDPEAIATPGIRGLSPYIPGRNAEQLREEFGIHDWIALASNENPYGPSPRVVRALNEFDATVGRYPDGAGTELRQTIAQYHNEGIVGRNPSGHSNTAITPNQITLGNGSDDVLALIGRVFADANSSVVFSQHSFAMYPIVTQSVGARAIEVAAKDYGHDLSAMLGVLQDNTKENTVQPVQLVFIANPNNPTGTCVFDEELTAFLDAVPANVMVVIDQAYAEYIEQDDYSDCAAWLSEYGNLIVTRTFSKIHGLAGLRCGYAVSSVSVADLLNRVRGPFNVNSIAMKAATVAITDAQYIAQCREANNSGLQQLIDGFAELGLDYVPSKGNFILVDVGRDAQPIFEQLLSQGIIVRPVGNYGLPNHLRITVGTPEENVAVLAGLKYCLN